MRYVMVGVMFAMVGCLGPSMAKYQPMTVQGQEESLYGASVRAVGEAGQTIENTDKEAGLVSTKWEGESVGDSADFRYRFRVQIVEGEAVVYIDCQQRATKSSTAFTGGDAKTAWERCADGKVPKHRIKIARQIAGAIERDQ